MLRRPGWLQSQRSTHLSAFQMLGLNKDICYHAQLCILNLVLDSDTASCSAPSAGWQQRVRLPLFSFLHPECPPVCSLHWAAFRGRGSRLWPLVSQQQNYWACRKLWGWGLRRVGKHCLTRVRSWGHPLHLEEVLENMGVVKLFNGMIP